MDEKKFLRPYSDFTKDDRSFFRWLVGIVSFASSPGVEPKVMRRRVLSQVPEKYRDKVEAECRKQRENVIKKGKLVWRK